MAICLEQEKPEALEILKKINEIKNSEESKELSNYLAESILPMLDQAQGMEEENEEQSDVQESPEKTGLLQKVSFLFKRDRYL